MTSLRSHYTALSTLELVLENSIPFDEDTLIFTTDGAHINRDGEEVGCEVFFFGIGSDIYSVKLYEDGGEVQRLDAIETWSVFPPDSNDEEGEVTTNDREEEED